MTSRLGGVAAAFPAAAVGAIVALLDALFRYLHPSIGFGASSLLGVVVFYATTFGLLGFGLGWIVRPRTVLAVTVSLGLLVLGAGYANVYLLPSLLDPRSLAFDAAAILGAFVLGWFLRRRLPDLSARRGSVLGILALVPTLVGAAYVSRTSTSTDAGATRVAAEGPNLVVVLFDALRPDHTSVYGYERDTTPHLAAFARDAMVFENAYAQSSWTKPSVATLFTGLYPESHGNHQVASRLPEALPTLPQALRDAGYRTAVFAENSFVSPLFGYDTGCDLLVGNEPDVVAQTVLGHLLHQLAVRLRWLQPVHDAAKFTNRFDRRQRGKRGGAMDLNASLDLWLRDIEGAPFFAYVHWMKPHAPYIAPAPFDGRFGAGAGSARGQIVNPPHVEGIAPFSSTGTWSGQDTQALIDNYDERILFADSLFSGLLDVLRDRGHAEDTAILVIADHGEEFGEHGLFDHGHSLQEGVIRVPFLVRPPGGTKGVRVERPVRLIDLPPTLLELAGLPPREDWDGVSVLEAVRPNAVPRPVLSQLRHGGEYWSNALVRDGLKLVRTQQGDRQVRRLFFLPEDPNESADIAVADHDPLVTLSAELDLAVELAGRRKQAANEMLMDPATEERLRALGYIK